MREAAPIASSSVTGELATRHNLASIRGKERLHSLKLLLENYEMFIPFETDGDEKEGQEKQEEEDQTWSEVEDKKKSYQQSRSKSADNIKKVEQLRLKKMRADRFTRSQSAQTNQVKQGLHSPARESRRKHSAPAGEIARGALHVQGIQPSVSKYDVKNLTKSSEPLFKSPSKRAQETAERSSSPNESDNENKEDLDENNDSAQQKSPRVPIGIDGHNPRTCARNELSFKSGSHWRDAEPKAGKDEDGDVGENDSLDTITYCFSEMAEYYSNLEETELHTAPEPAKVTPREIRSRTASCEQRRKSRNPHDNIKVSIKNILPQFPLDVESPTRATNKSVVKEVNNKPPRYWRPKPKSAFRKHRSILTEQDSKELVNTHPDHLAHASVKARRTSMVVHGKGLIDTKVSFTMLGFLW